jgi:hypothetical protein
LDAPDWPRGPAISVSTKYNRFEPPGATQLKPKFPKSMTLGRVRLGYRKVLKILL